MIALTFIAAFVIYALVIGALAAATNGKDEAAHICNALAIVIIACYVFAVVLLKGD